VASVPQSTINKGETMLRSRKQALIAIAAIVLGATSTLAFAQQGRGTQGYLTDQRNGIVKDPFNLCWRTGYFTPALANCECDVDLLPRDVCFPPAPKPAAAPPPAPAPKPAVVPPPKPVTEKVTFAADVFFDFDKSVLKPEGKAKLDDLVSKIKGIALEVIIAIGHTDSIGSVEYNLKLSVRRAEAVKAYLVSKGIEPNRIYTEGKGPSQLVKKCVQKDFKNFAEYVACNQPNRRVEVEVVGTRQK
jgi:OOP family OmpA-OmpF porin